MVRSPALSSQDTMATVNEREIKLPVEQVAAIRRRLRGLGYKSEGGRLFERNLLFDTPEQSLRRSSQLLRLRSKGSRWWLTFKARPQTEERHKVRLELEVEMRDGARLMEILHRLGFEAVFEYQKYRTEFRRPGSRGEALLDETPIGNFLELEGPPGWIDRMARALGYRQEDYILVSYGALYLAWSSERGIAPTHMTFPAKKSLRTIRR